MLTKNDLSQLRKVVREEIEAEVQSAKDELGADLKMAQIRILTETDKIKDRLKNVEIRLTKIEKNLKASTDFLDKENLKTQKRVVKIEEHLGLTAA